MTYKTGYIKSFQASHHSADACLDDHLNKSDVSWHPLLDIWKNEEKCTLQWIEEE